MVMVKSRPGSGLPPQNQRMSTFNGLATDGFVDLGVFLPGLTTAEAAKQIARLLGCSSFTEADVLRPHHSEERPLNTYGGNFGLQSLPLHTDLAHWHRPPRYVMLRCVVGSVCVRTPLLHHMRALQGVNPAIVRRALFRPRRRLAGRMFFVRILDDQLFRWDQLFLEPENAEADQVREVLTTLAATTATSVGLDETAHTLLIDNWAVMHGRDAVPATAMSRCIERVYFEGGGV